MTSLFAFLDKKNHGNISAITNIVQATSILCGVAVFAYNIYVATDQAELEANRQSLLLIEEFYEELFPEVTLASYRSISPEPRGYGWPRASFDSYNIDLVPEGWTNERMGEEPKIEDLILKMEPFYLKVQSLLGLQLIDAQQMCFGINNSTLAYLRVLQQRSSAVNIHNIFTGQNTFASYAFSLTCYERFKNRYVPFPEFAKYATIEFEPVLKKFEE